MDMLFIMPYYCDLDLLLSLFKLRWRSRFFSGLKLSKVSRLFRVPSSLRLFKVSLSSRLSEVSSGFSSYSVVNFLRHVFSHCVLQWFFARLTSKQEFWMSSWPFFHLWRFDLLLLCAHLLISVYLAFIRLLVAQFFLSLTSQEVRCLHYQFINFCFYQKRLAPLSSPLSQLPVDHPLSLPLS